MTLAATALMIAALTAGLAVAAEAPSRNEYVAKLEKICKPDALATQRVMKGAKADIRAERIAVAARKFAKATAIFGSTVKTISAVSRPEEDLERLRKWFTYLKRQYSYIERITAQLQADRPARAQRLVPRFIHNGNLANNVVLAFGFDYCSFKFSRYG